MSAADIAAVLDEHLRSEFEARDAEATMVTMVAEPYLLHVPTAGGVGHDEVLRFYRDFWLPSWPEDTAVEPVSRTAGTDRVVDELVVSFTHERPMPFMLPGV